MRILAIAILFAPLICLGATTAENITFTAEQKNEAIKIQEEGLVVLGDMLFRGADVRSGGYMVKRWPNGIVPLAFDANVSVNQRSAFMQACAAWGVGTSVRCVDRSSEQNFVRVHTHSGELCGGVNVSCSAIGMIGKAQFLYVYTTHWNAQSILQHELGHALGLIHEQSRPDRDDYVLILYQNIKPGTAYNFDKQGASPLTDYDYFSTMHYSNCSFSIHQGCNSTTENLQTITPRACHLAGAVGGQTVTTLDMDGMRRMYATNLIGSLPNTRRSECGALTYSPKQVQILCGDNCIAAKALPIKRKETIAETWCGTMTIKPNPDESFCMTRVNKSLIRFWWNHDHHCGFLDTKNEHTRFTECGCPVTQLTSSCTDTDAFPSDAAMNLIADNGDKIDRRSAALLRLLSKREKAGMLGTDLKPNLIHFIIENRSTRGAPWRLSYLRYRLWWAGLRNGAIDAELFQRHANAAGLDTDSLKPQPRLSAEPL